MFNFLKEKINPIKIQKMDLHKIYDYENKSTETQLLFDVGDIIRVFKGTKYRVWKITGIHLGALGCESLVSLIPLDIKKGCAFGKTEDCVMPYDLLITHLHIEKI